MNSLRQTWLVALREIRERGRSKAFRASVVLMIVVVVAAIILPTLIDSGTDTKDVGLAGTVPTGLPEAIEAQGDAIDVAARTQHYDSVIAGQAAVRDGDIDVLVVNGQRLEWRRHTDEQLQAVVVGAIQLVAIQERAEAAGIDSVDLLAPVDVSSVELGAAAGRTADDETAAMLMTVLLFLAISTYGNLVLTGVVEEKSSRVVEVLLARMPARNLLAGKVAGIGALGLAQFCVTAVAALAATTVADSVDIPAVRGAVLAWVVVWFVLGYALYAMVYGALGSLASRVEDAQSAAGPVMVVLITAYFASFAAVGEPSGGLAQVLSLLPPTAPLVMPNRIAMGVAPWWELTLAVVICAATTAGLVVFAGRVYARAILHSGPMLSWRQALRRGAAPAAAD